MSKNKSGFTLLEMSIVLVIIGLIVGAILSGTDLIKAAEIRATVTQYEKYRTAVYTFRNKFGALPGDISPDLADRYDLFVLEVLNAPDGFGDADGRLEDGEGTYNVAGENLVFWRHLAQANLVDGNYSEEGDNIINPATGHVTTNTTNVYLSLPLAKLGRGNYFTVYSQDAINYFQLHPVSGLFADGSTTGNIVGGMTPIEAQSIDQKIDDGAPNSGHAQARATDTALAPINLLPVTWTATTTPNNCLLGGTSAADLVARYNVNRDSGGMDPSCALRMRL